MTPEEQNLLQAVCDDPYTAAPRLAYAAWMETQKSRRLQGEAIRLAVSSDETDLRRLKTVDERVKLLEVRDRQRELEKHEDEWKREVLTIADDCELRQGLPAGVTLKAKVFLKRAGDLFRMAPIVHVRLTEARDHLKALYTMPEAEKIRALTLDGQGLQDMDMRRLARASSLGNLWYLDLGNNKIEIDGVESLAVSDHFPNLTHVVLDGNPGDVHEQAGLELAIVHVWMPAQGQEVEAVYGRIPWLHFPEACWEEYPPDPCGPPLK